MKTYKINDLQGVDFWSWTHDEPQTLNALRSHFWSYDEIRTTKYSEFTKAFIEDAWEVEFIEVKE